jgi:hypothetical protein
MFNVANQLMHLNKKQDIRYGLTILAVEVCVIYAIYILTQGAKHVKMQ